MPEKLSKLLWERRIGCLRITWRWYFGDYHIPQAKGGHKLEWYWREKYTGALGLQSAAIRLGNTLHWWSWGPGWTRDYDEKTCKVTSDWYQRWFWPDHHWGKLG
jgi:hypothetical protein